MRFVHRLGRVRSVRGLVVLVFGLWLMLRQVDGVLVRLQSDVAGSYGANDFWRPSPGGLVVHVRTLVEVWRANGGVAKAAFFTYTALDLVFIAAYSVLFLLLFARLSPPPAWRERPTVLGRLAARRGRLIAGLAFTDIVEDVLRAVLVSQDHPSAVLIYLAWAATWLKWVLLGCVVMLIVHAWAAHVASQPPAHLWSAVGRLRIPVVLIVSWGAFVLFDPTR